MVRLFNSSFENGLRLLILLNTFNSPQNADMLYAADFMVVYGKTFGLANEDLNGDNQYKYSEFMSRRVMVQKALKELVLIGYVMPLQVAAGIEYNLTKTGKDYCESLDSDYAKEYRDISESVVKYVGARTERSLIAEINRMSAISLKEAIK